MSQTSKRLCLSAIIAMVLGMVCPLQAVAQEWISELYLACASTSEEAEKILKDKGYEILMYNGEPADFNEGCGPNSDYIYLGFKRDPNPANAIGELRFFCYTNDLVESYFNTFTYLFWKEDPDFKEVPSNHSYADFNHGAGGDWIRLFYRKARPNVTWGYGAPLESLQYHLDDDNLDTGECIRADYFAKHLDAWWSLIFVDEYTCSTKKYVDLNKGSGGAKVYLGANYHVHRPEKYYEVNQEQGTCRIGFLNCPRTDPKWNCDMVEYQGTGTEEDPLLIDTKEKLGTYFYFARLGWQGPELSTKHLKLTADIDMGDNGFDLSDVPFTGVLDGGGHTIKNFRGPLFKSMKDATIKNLNITVNQKNVEIAKIWGFLALNATYSRIENCHVCGTYNCDLWYLKPTTIACFIGTVENVDFKDCSTSMEFGSDDVTCGFAVNMKTSHIDNCLVVNDKFKNKDYPFFYNMGEFSSLKNSYVTSGSRPIYDMNTNPETGEYIYAEIDNCSYIKAGDLKSGEWAWKLNGNKNAGVWRQTLGKDNFPSGKITSGAVYMKPAYRCDDPSKTVDSSIQTWQFTNDADAAPIMGHNNLKHSTKLAPTCTSDGHKEYWSCQYCNKKFAEVACINEVTDQDLVIPSAEGHNYVNGICQNAVCKDKYQPTEVVGDTHRAYNYGQLCYFERNVIRYNVWNGDYLYQTMPNLEIMSDIVANDVPICDEAGNLLYTGDPKSLMEWTPICADAYFNYGDQLATYTGNVYGNGHTISGLVCRGSDRAAFIDGMEGRIERLAIVNSWFESKMEYTSEGNRAAAFVCSVQPGFEIYSCIANARIDSKQYAKGIAVSEDGGEFGMRCFFYGFLGDENGDYKNKRYISSGEALTDANLASGEITYILNGSKSDNVDFVQKIEGDNRDLLPRLANENHGETVYYNSTCTDPDDYSYTNIEDRKHPNRVYHERPNTCFPEYWECPDCHAKVNYFNDPINWESYAHKLEKVEAVDNCVYGHIKEHYYCTRCGIRMMTEDKYNNTPAEKSELLIPGSGHHTFGATDTGHIRHYSCTVCNTSQEEDYDDYVANFGKNEMLIPIEKTDNGRYLINRMNFTLGQNGECYTIYDDFLTARTAVFTEAWIKGRTWGTKCLPFDFQPSLNKMFKYYVPSSIDLKSADQAVFMLKEVTDEVIKAGTPVFVMAVDPEMESYTIYGYDANICNTAYDEGVKPNTDCNPYQLTGSLLGKIYNAPTTPGEAYYLSGDKLWHATGTFTVKPYRAYVETTAAASAKISSFIFVTEENEGIDQIQAVYQDGEMKDVEAVYDLNGRKLPGMQKGVNVIKMKDGSVKKVTMK